MLKITIDKHESETHFILEGRLTGLWVTELHQVIISSDSAPDAVNLNLEGLRFVDQHGINLLRDLSSWGVRLISLPPFVMELLKEGQQNKG